MPTHNLLIVVDVLSTPSRRFRWDHLIELIPKFTYNELVGSLCFLTDYNFERFCNLINKQVIGSIMGTNCAPLIANIFLCHYESVQIEKISDEKTN